MCKFYKFYICAVVGIIIENFKYIRVEIFLNSTEYNITDNLRSLISLNKNCPPHPSCNTST